MRSQRAAGVVHHVVDGASTDGTLEELARHPHLRVTSQPDAGLYDALNRGIAAADGDLIGWLNADDEYPLGTFERVEKMWRQDPAVELIGGATERVRDGCRVDVIPFPSQSDLWRGRIVWSNVGLNGCFFAPRLLRRIGAFDARYRVLADRDYLFRVCAARPKCAVVPEVFYWQHLHAGQVSAQEPGFPPETILVSGRTMRRPEMPGWLRAKCREWLRTRAAHWYARYLRRGDPWSAARLFAIVSADDPGHAAWLGLHVAQRILCLPAPQPLK